MSGIATALHRLLPGPIRGRLPLTPPHRRIFILPSRFGLVYGLALAFLMLGALNYNNNPAILLAMLLGSAALASSILTVRHLSRATLAEFRFDEAVAGQAQTCRLLIQLPAGAGQGEIGLRHDGVRMSELPGADGGVRFQWQWPSQRRGRRPLGRLRLSSSYPLGLFHAWCDLEPALETVVFPTSESPMADWPTARASTATTMRSALDPDEWHALREFQRGDSLREIAWKVSARHDRWLVTESTSQQQDPSLDFGLDQVATMEREQGISRLAAWIDAADGAGLAYTLNLPTRSIGPQVGIEQRRAALTALADLP